MNWWELQKYWVPRPFCDVRCCFLRPNSAHADSRRASSKLMITKHSRSYKRKEKFRHTTMKLSRIPILLLHIFQTIGLTKAFILREIIHLRQTNQNWIKSNKKGVLKIGGLWWHRRHNVVSWPVGATGDVLWTRRSMADVRFCGCRHVTLASSLGVFSWYFCPEVCPLLLCIWCSVVCFGWVKLILFCSSSLFYFGMCCFCDLHESTVPLPHC